MPIRSAALALLLLTGAAVAQGRPEWSASLDSTPPVAVLAVPETDDIRMVLSCVRGGIEVDPQVFPEARPTGRVALRFEVDGQRFVRPAAVAREQNEMMGGYAVTAVVPAGDPLLAAMAGGRRVTVATEPRLPGTAPGTDDLAGSGRAIRALLAHC